MADTFFGFDASLPKSAYKDQALSFDDDSENSDIDLLNNETFGGTDIKHSAEEWERQHEHLSRMFKNEKHDVPRQKDSPDYLEPFHMHPQQQVQSTSDEDEEEIIENTISQLGLDDEQDYEIKRDHHSQGFEYQEMRDSWMSPSRIKEKQPDSLQELISPGDGVWSSPSRKELLPDRMYSSAFASSDHVVPQMHYPSPPRKEGSSGQMPRQKDGDATNILKQFFAADNMVPPIAAQSPASLTRTGTIRAEDLERELNKERKPSRGDELSPPPPFARPRMDAASVRLSQTPQTPVSQILRLSPVALSSPAGFPSTPSPGLHYPLPSPGLDPAMFMSMMSGAPPPPGLTTPLTPDMSNLAKVMLMNPQLLQMTGASPRGLAGLSPAALFSPQYFARHPFLADPATHPEFQQRGTHRGRALRGGWVSGRGGRGTYQKWSGQERQTWNRWQPDDPHSTAGTDQEREPWIEMPASKMMTSKEKEWIMRIAMMSLLTGDPYISDYYFISYMNKELLRKAQLKLANQNKEISEGDNADDSTLTEDIENAKKLIDYAQKHQKAKESYKPVKFEGSLGKLSITSVHHPRQIVDLTPDVDSKVHVQESSRKKFALYSVVEKAYTMYLSLGDIERQLLEVSPEERDQLLEERRDRINNLFDLLKIKLHKSESSASSEEHERFNQLMSIAKARKLLVRIFLLFDQEQSESLLIAALHALTYLLKADGREQALSGLDAKVSLLIDKSDYSYRSKCLKLMRKINLTTLLQYSLSIRILRYLLKAIDSDVGHGLDWTYYESEVPKAIASLSPQTRANLRTDLEELSAFLNTSKFLSVEE